MMVKNFQAVYDSKNEERSMKLLKVSLFLFCLIFNSLYAQKMSEVWGRIVKVPKKESLFGHQYFVYLQLDGKSVAYPIEVKTKEELKNLEESKNQIAQISGEAFVQDVRRGELKDKIIVFRLKSIRAIKLSDLSFKGDQVELVNNNDKNREVIVAPKITIEDKVANTLIFSAAAVLAGSIVKALAID